MAEADFDKWETRYRSGRDYGGDPNTWLTDVAAAYLPDQGRALDLAGGSGRHARWLASRGLKTTLLDIAPAGLELARDRAAAEGLTLQTLAHDLDAGLPVGQWDVVLISFFLIRPVRADLHRIVAPGGLFLHIHPTRTNLERHERPSARWLLEPGELTGVPGFDTLLLEESWGRTGRHEVRYVGRKRP